jgi:phosphonate transport system ATP-binding protein
VLLAARELVGPVGGERPHVEALQRGERQRPVLLAPLLADEPVASLDPRNTRLVMDALADANKRYGITVLR